MSKGTVEQIKSRLNIEDVLSSYIQLEKSGKNLKAKCPFHNEKTASFYISPDRGTYYCFGCGAKGDMFTFIQEFEGVDFIGALKILAEKAGVELKPINRQELTEKERMYDIMEIATSFYQESLRIGDKNNEDKESKEAIDYLKKRGVKDETINSFRIGYAKPGWRNLYTILKSKGYTDSEIEKSGLAKKPDGELGGKGYYDRFRDRIMFPIMDSSGRVIAFSGRILHDDGKSAKYINSPDTLLYDKSTILYGLDKAKSEIRRKNYTILVEGQMDLIMSHQVDIKNTVAASGTALSDEIVSEKTNSINNLGVINRLSNNVIIAFDSDLAGQKATMRASVIALNLGMDVKVASIVGGKDPADLVNTDPESWKNALRNAKPIILFALDTVLERIQDKRKIPKVVKDEVLPFVARLKGGMEQAHYIKIISEKLGINEASVWQDLKDVALNISQNINQKTNNINNGIIKPINSAQESPPYGQKSRGDIAENRLIGLSLYLRGAGKEDESKKIFDLISNISGNSFEEIINNREKSSLLLMEAEILYGESKNLEKTIKELLLVYEEESIKIKFGEAMSLLNSAESKKDEDKSRELMILCQKFSNRLNEIKEELKKI